MFKVKPKLARVTRENAYRLHSAEDAVAVVYVVHFLVVHLVLFASMRYK